MNVLLMVLGVVVVIVLCVLIAATRRPKDFRIERSIETSASARDVYSVISDLGRFTEWSPWQNKDPNMTVDIQGEPGTIGSSHAWEGNKDVGSGKMTITEAVKDERVDLRLDFLKPFKATNQVTWRVDEEDGQRRISWIMDGRNDTIVAQVFGMFMDMDKMVGKDFEAGLASLKSVAEA